MAALTGSVSDCVVCCELFVAMRRENSSRRMTMKVDIVRAWKDAAYRGSLSADELSQVPANPAGAIELSDEELDGIAGGMTNVSIGATSCCEYYGKPK
jgi:mersacidin/lichenicidin family type 2 lantibiotic